MILSKNTNYSIYGHTFWALFVIFNFLGPKKERGHTDTHMGLGPQNPTKKLSQNHVSNFFDLGPTPFPYFNNSISKYEINKSVLHGSILLLVEQIFC